MLKLRRFIAVVFILMLLVGVLPASGSTRGSSHSVAIRTDLWARLNNERSARHLSPLKWNGRLSDAAALWSRHMGVTGQFVHSDLRRFLGPYNYLGENIAHGKESASGLHLSWMGSQPHRDDMLSPAFTEAGIGIWCGPDHQAWATVNFARRWVSGTPPAYKGGTPPNPVARADKNNIKC